MRGDRAVPVEDGLRVRNGGTRPVQGILLHGCNAPLGRSPRAFRASAVLRLLLPPALLGAFSPFGRRSSLRGASFSQAMLAIALGLLQPLQPLSRVSRLQGEVLVQRAGLQLLQLTKLTGLQLRSLAKLPATKLLPNPRSRLSEIPFLLCGTRLLLFPLPPLTFPRTLGLLPSFRLLRRGTPLAQQLVVVLLRVPYARYAKVLKRHLELSSL